MFTFFLKIIFFLLVIGVLCGIYRTIQIGKSETEKRFLTGKIPKTLPDGLYSGTAEGYSGSWMGKNFKSAEQKGINLFKKGDVIAEKYPFRTSVTAGIRNPDLRVIAINYDLPENPFWLRPVLDEIVEVAPGEFLGKLHYRLLTLYPFSLGFFRLKK